MTLPPDEPEKDWRASLPFPAHWLAYIAIKLVVLAWSRSSRFIITDCSNARR